MDEIRLNKKICVENAICVLFEHMKKYGAKFIQDHWYPKDRDENTIYQIYGLETRYDGTGEYFEGIPLYDINPHAGDLLENKKTNYITIQPRHGQPLEMDELDEIRSELFGLK